MRVTHIVFSATLVFAFAAFVGSPVFAAILELSRKLGGRYRALGMAVLLATPMVAASHTDIDEQLARVNAWLSETPNEYSLIAKLGELHGQHGDWQLAVAELRRAQALAPEAAAASLDLHLGVALFRAGNAQQSLTFVDRYLSDHAYSSTAWRTRAQINASLDATDTALADYERSIDCTKVPTPELYIERARLLEHDSDRFDELLAGIDDGIIRLGPLVTLIDYAISIELQRDNHDGALTYMALVPERMRQQPRWLHQKSKLLKEMGRDADAKSMNREALQAIEMLPAARRENAAYRALRHQIEDAHR